MLTDDYGAAVSLPDALGDQQDAAGKDVRIYVQHDLISFEPWGVVQEPCARVRREGGRRERSDHFLPEAVTVGAGGLLPGLQVCGIGPGPVVGAAEFRLPQAALGVVDELVELALETPGGVRSVPAPVGRYGRGGRRIVRSEGLQEGCEGELAPGQPGLAPDQRERGGGLKAGYEGPGALELGLDLFHRRCMQPAGRGSLLLVGGLGRDVDFRVAGGFEDERPGRYEAGDFGVSELPEEAEEVAVDRFLPQVLTGLKVSGDGRCANAGVYRRGVKCDQPALAVSEQADRMAVLRKGVHCRQDFLYFVADDVPAQLVGRPVDKLPVRMVGQAHFGGAGMGVAPVDEQGDEDAAAVFRQPPTDLRLFRQAGLQTGPHLGGNVAVGQRDNAGDRLPLGLEQEAFAVDAFQGIPADFINLVPGTRRNLRTGGRYGGHNLDAGRLPGIDQPDHLPQAPAVRLYRFYVGLV